MSTPLPPDLAQLERALEAARAPLPPDLRARVLAVAADARPAPDRRLSTGWFAAGVAVAAAVFLNLSTSAALALAEPAFDAPDRCAVARALHEPPEHCLEPSRPDLSQEKP
jgi:hypothetical protein